MFWFGLVWFGLVSSKEMQDISGGSKSLCAEKGTKMAVGMIVSGRNLLEAFPNRFNGTFW